MKRLLLLLGVLGLPASAPAVEVVMMGYGAGAVVTPVTQIFVAGNVTTIPTSAATNYSFPTSFAVQSYGTTESDHEAIMASGTISELRVQTSGDIGAAGDTVAFTVRICDPTCADTALTCTITGGGGTQQTCTDLVNSFHIDFGERITMKIVTVDTPSGVTPNWTFKWVGDNSNESMIASNYIADSALGTECGNASGGVRAARACTFYEAHVPAAENFTITNLYARAATDLGVLDNRQITLFKNGAAESTCRVTLDDTTQAASDACSIAFDTSSTPDYVSVEDDPGATNTYVDNVAFTLVMTQGSQRFQLSTCDTSSPSTSAVNYAYLIGTTSTWNATETNRDLETDGFTMTGIAFRGTPAPDNGAGTQTYEWMMRDDVANVFACSTSEATGTCNASGSTAVADGSLIDLRATPASTPLAPTAWCLSWSGTGT